MAPVVPSPHTGLTGSGAALLWVLVLDWLTLAVTLVALALALVLVLVLALDTLDSGSTILCVFFLSFFPSSLI